MADTADGRGKTCRLINSEHEHHAADEVHQQVAGNAGTVFLPAPPPGEDQRIEWDFRRHIALPGIPIEIGWRQTKWWREPARSSPLARPPPCFEELRIPKPARSK